MPFSVAVLAVSAADLVMTRKDHSPLASHKRYHSTTAWPYRSCRALSVRSLYALPEAGQALTGLKSTGTVVAMLCILRGPALDAQALILAESRESVHPDAVRFKHA